MRQANAIPISLYRVTVVVDNKNRPVLGDDGQPQFVVADEPDDFLFSPLAESDLEILDTWVRRRAIRMVRDSFDDDMSEDEKRFELEIAYNQAGTLTWMSPHGAKLMATIEGMSYLAWLALRKRHPDVTRQELSLMMTDERNIAEVGEALEESGEQQPFPQARTSGRNNNGNSKNTGKVRTKAKHRNKKK